MARPMTFQMSEHLRKRGALALLASIEHPDGTGYFWTGIGPLPWNGQTWTGSSVLGTVTPIKHTSDLVIQEIQFQLAGVNQKVASQLDDNVRNKSGQVWLAGINRGSVVPDPYRIVNAQLDYQSLDAGDDGSVILSITARTGFYTLERAMDEVWSAEDQRLLYPNDSGCDLIPALQNQDIQWTPT
jgi:hypothetical protein